MKCANIGTNLEMCRLYRNNKKRAYQEGLEEFWGSSKAVNIGGQAWFAHPNINMYVDVTEACNGNCGFCIAKTTFSRADGTDKQFLSSLANAMQLIKHLNPSIQIVGGEPTLSPRLYPILDMLDLSSLRNPVIGTNGYGLSNRLVERINRSRIQHLNVSRHHYVAKANQQVMQMNPFFSNKAFWAKLEAVDSYIAIRLQCNLIQGYIDCYSQVMIFLEWARVHGIRNVVFAQLTPLPRDDIYKPEIIDYVAARQVDADVILKCVEKNHDFEFVKYRGGVACYYEVWTYLSDTTVIFKFSDNYYLGLADKLEQYLPDLVAHTDGTLCGSWNKKIKVLLEATNANKPKEQLISQNTI